MTIQTHHPTRKHETLTALRLGMNSKDANRDSTLTPRSHCKPSRAEPIWLGKQTYVMKWKHSYCKPNRAEPNRACSLANVCFYSPADYGFCCAIGLTSWGSNTYFLFTMRANGPTLDCEVLISAVHLRPALWEQSYKTYQNRDLRPKLWEEVAAECDSSCKQKYYFLIY